MDKNAPLVRNSDYKRFANVMLADKAERNRINNCHEYINISESAFSTKTVEKGTICKNSIEFIKVKSNISNSSGYFASKENSNFLNSNNLVVISGIFTIKNGHFNLPICNLVEVDVIILGKIKLGIIHPANAKTHGNENSSTHKVCPSAVPVHSLAVHSSTVQTDQGVHVLDHSPENKLTIDQKNEKIKFLKDQLKLGESVLNPKEQDE